MKRLLAIGLLWFGCAAAWMVLGSTVVVRSGEQSSQLLEEVHRLWGPPIEQAPPHAAYHENHWRKEKVTSTEGGRRTETEVERAEDVAVDVPLDGSDLRVALTLTQRQKGLLWFPTYGIAFQGRYAFANPSPTAQKVEIVFPLGRENAVYDGFGVTTADGAPVAARIAGGEARFTTDLGPGERREFLITYRSRGTARWTYQLTAGTGQVRAFHLVLDTDFARIDFPAGTLSPSAHQARGGGGWHGEWHFDSLVASAPLGIELPQRLNPGPLAARITFFAPVGLLFFFFVVAVLATAGRRAIHPLNYFFFGCAFFAFHLLFAYLVDHLAILPAFALSSAVSIALVVTYARLFVGWRFALREMGLSQLIYLVLFSTSFFFSGFTGLAITIGAILTLFVMMQFTGRTRWAELAKPGPDAPAGAAPGCVRPLVGPPGP